MTYQEKLQILDRIEEDAESMLHAADDCWSMDKKINHIEAALKRLGEDEANFINTSKYFATRGDYLEADSKERIKYANEALK